MNKQEKNEFLKLDLFSETEGEELRNELLEVKLSVDKLRRSLFKRHSDIARMVHEMQENFETLQHQIFILEGYIKKRL